ncbi:NAD(+) diphosphatase [Erythrobacter litoralis]|uniref:NAD(+) diphosphatase n=1 Tax=Erythrobacter litoralis TaxID=39960 RepID=UPI002435E3E2|nr:NAD(+) diphosphatase [Erythrobacter litoralis]MDG6078563.1 NAD(+) diphosphatase [Erythrobacter litoralis]
MNWKARLLALDGLTPSLTDEGRLAWTTLADADPDAELVFLGLDEGKACFAAVPPRGDSAPRLANPALWDLMATLPTAELALYGGARSIVDWHARHRFCAQCGGTTRIAKGGWQRTCENCGADHFPRTDPVTIMLVEHDGRMLLGRGKGWGEGRFSALAGFVEPGESLEEGVAREVLEESGIVIRPKNVRYVASQPWPFPSQLMIGCHAFAETDDITRDETELDEIRWFSRDEVAASLSGSGPFIAPPKQAIASYLLNWWIER